MEKKKVQKLSFSILHRIFLNLFLSLMCCAISYYLYKKTQTSKKKSLHISKTKIAVKYSLFSVVVVKKLCSKFIFIKLKYNNTFITFFLLCTHELWKNFFSCLPLFAFFTKRWFLPVQFLTFWNFDVKNFQRKIYFSM
jgi:hypothetical protein